MSTIKVMVVDDSAVVRQVVAGLLGAATGIEVIAAVADPLLAIERLKQQWPDVIVLDVEMPRMDGITFLRKIMAERPTPVVICSTLTDKGAKTTMEALAAGAVAIVTKPKLGLKQFLNESADELVATVRMAARDLLQAHGIEIVSESLFGDGHRQIAFDVGTGHVWARQVSPAGAAAHADDGRPS